MSVAVNVAKLRKSLRLSQKELALRVGVNRSILNRIENGVRPVREAELKLFAEYFNVSADFLIGRETPKAAPLSTEQIALLKGFEALDAVGRKTLIETLNSLREAHASTT